MQVIEVGEVENKTYYERPHTSVIDYRDVYSLRYSSGWLHDDPGSNEPVNRPSIYLTAFVKLGQRIARLEEVVLEISDRLKETPVTSPIFLYDLNSGTHELKSPILALLEQYDEGVVVRVPELQVHSFGESESEAISEIKRQLIELTEELSEISDETLGTGPRRVQRLLSALVSKDGS